MTENNSAIEPNLEENLPLIHGSNKVLLINKSKSDVQKMDNKTPKKVQPELTFVDKGMKEHSHSNGTPTINVETAEENCTTPVEKHNKVKVRRISDVIDSFGSNSMESRRRSLSLSENVQSAPSSPLANSRRGSVGLPTVPTPPSTPSTPVTPASDIGYNSSFYSTPHTPNEISPDIPSRPLKPRRLHDTVDAAVMNTASVEPTGLPVPEAYMSVEKDADEYNMNHPQRGHAVIFNNDKFDTEMSDRAGSEVDVDNLHRLYTALGFHITIHHNKEYREIKEIIDNLADADHSDEDCLVITLLTHGMGTDYVLSKDVPYRTDLLWSAFTGDKCLTLAGKPKIFIIQACRGEKLDSGVNLSRRKSRTETDSSSGGYKIPSHADFLIAYSSVEGYYSWRNPESGTWFIQCLCQELMENCTRLDFLKILTRTSRRVALEHESYNDRLPWQHQQKQVPSINSMLIRDVYFRPKK